MKKAQLVRVSGGWRVAIIDGKRTQVLENYFDNEEDAVSAAVTYL